MIDVVVYTNLHLQSWQEAYRDGMVMKDDFASAWSTWSSQAQRALWAVGYDADLFVDLYANCEVYERFGIEQGEPLGTSDCDLVEKVLRTIPVEV